LSLRVTEVTYLNIGEDLSILDVNFILFSENNLSASLLLLGLSVFILIGLFMALTKPFGGYYLLAKLLRGFVVLLIYKT
jgi:hypothetical protein